jgi:glutamyl-tRNA reductase
MAHQPQAPLTTTIRAVRGRAERIRQQELARRNGQLQGLDPRQQATVDQLTRRLVDQLLRDPIICGTRLAANSDGPRHVDLLRFLYAVEQELTSPPYGPDHNRRQA